jgi:putative chitinase
MITLAQLAKACDCPTMRAANWLGPINDALKLFDINTPRRMAEFLPQIAHESGRLQFVRELWGPTDAQRRYEGRKDLGNTEPGDGFRYRGRGLIQTTGRTNYQQARDGLRRFLPGVPDFEAVPDLLQAPKWAAYSAGLFWASRRLNELADKGDFIGITKRINGGTNGLSDRKKLRAAAMEALGVKA